MLSKIRIALQMQGMLLLLIFVGSAQALELGEANVESFLNEPLKASVNIAGIAAIDLIDIKISVANEDSYRYFGITPPPNLPRLGFEIVAGNEARHQILVTSVRPIKEPIVQFLMEIVEKQSRTLQLYTFLIDPAISAQSSPATSYSIPELDQSNPEGEALEEGELIAVLEPEIVVERPVEIEPVVDQKATPEPSNTAMPGTIRVAGKGISLIAQESVLHQRFSVYQIMRAFYLQNIDVFERRNISKLPTGSLLAVPSDELIGEVSRNQAIEFVLSVSLDYPDSAAGIGELAQLESAMDTSPEAQQMSSTSSLNEQAKSTKKIPSSVAVDSASDTTTPTSSADSGDIAESVMVNAEPEISVQENSVSASASIINRATTGVQTENASDSNGLEMQSELSQSIESPLINRDTSSVATSSIIPPPPEIVALPVAVPPPPQNVIIPEAIPLAPEIVTETRSVAPAESGYSWLMIIAILVIVILLMVIAVIWALYVRKEKDDAPQQEKRASNYSRSSQPKVNKMDVSFIGKKSDLLEEDTTEIREKSRKKKFKLGSINEICAEIDIYIGYELYTEGLEFIVAAKEVNPDEGMLDIKHLEILSKAKNAAEFLPLYLKREGALAKQFPNEWSRIVEMKDQMVSRGKQSMAQGA